MAIGRTGLAIVFLACAMAPSAAGEVLITVDKAAQNMSVAVNGEVRHTWPVSTGKAGYHTPNGSFTAFRMAKEHFYREWDDAPMPHSIFFTQRGHAIHGSFETRRLGTPASHGCVRLAPENAETLFNLVKAEGLSRTKVVVTGSEPAVVAARHTQDGERIRRTAATQQRQASARRKATDRASAVARRRSRDQVREAAIRREARRQLAAAGAAPRLVRIQPAFGQAVMPAGDYWGGWWGGW